MRIELSCPTCGGNNFSLDDAATDESVVSCADCGRVVGTLGDLKDRVARQVLAERPPLAA